MKKIDNISGSITKSSYWKIINKISRGIREYSASITLIVFISSILSANAAFVDFEDDFNGSSLDSSVWTLTGYGDIVTVANSELSLGIAGSSHHGEIISVRNDFDFFSNNLTVTWVINPTNSMAGDVTGTSNTKVLGRLSIFNGSTYNDYKSKSRVQLELLKNYEQVLTLNSQVISAMPSVIKWEINSQNYTVTISDSTFVSSEKNTYTVTHGLSKDDFSQFRCIQTTAASLITDFFAMVSDSISVTGSAGSTGTLIVIK